jgi:hypothetical protein
MMPALGCTHISLRSTTQVCVCLARASRRAPRALHARRRRHRQRRFRVRLDYRASHIDTVALQGNAAASLQARSVCLLAARKQTKELGVTAERIIGMDEGIVHGQAGLCNRRRMGLPGHYPCAAARATANDIQAVVPPSITSVWPVMNDASSEAT